MFVLSRAADGIRSLNARFATLRLSAISVRAFGSRPPKSRHKWSEEEEASIVKLFHAGLSVVDIGERTGRSSSAIHKRLYKLRQQGLVSYRAGAPRPSFSQEEDDRLFAAMQKRVSLAEISAMFPSRTVKALQSRFERISARRRAPGTVHANHVKDDAGRTTRHVRFYSEEEDARILHLRFYEKLSIAQIAHLLSRSTSSLKDHWKWLHRSRNGMGDPPFVAEVADEYEELKRTTRLPDWFYGLGSHQRRWTSREVSRFKVMVAAGSSAEEIAAALSRSVIAVRARRKLYCRDLKFHGMRALWTEAQKSKLLSMKARGHSYDEIAEELSSSRAAVKDKYYRLLKQGPRATQTEEAEATEGEPAVLKQEQSSEQRLQLRHSHAGS